MYCIGWMLFASIVVCLSRYSVDFRCPVSQSPCLYLTGERQFSRRALGRGLRLFEGMPDGPARKSDLQVCPWKCSATVPMCCYYVDIGLYVLFMWTISRQSFARQELLRRGDWLVERLHHSPDRTIAPSISHSAALSHLVYSVLGFIPASCDNHGIRLLKRCFAYCNVVTLPLRVHLQYSLLSHWSGKSNQALLKLPWLAGQLTVVVMSVAAARQQGWSVCHRVSFPILYNDIAVSRILFVCKWLAERFEFDGAVDLQATMRSDVSLRTSTVAHASSRGVLADCNCSVPSTIVQLQSRTSLNCDARHGVWLHRRDVSRSWIPPGPHLVSSGKPIRHRTISKSLRHPQPKWFFLQPRTNLTQGYPSDVSTWPVEHHMKNQFN